MKEFLESLIGAYKGRYQNKFIGTFALFYLGLSWKNVVAIFFISEFSYENLVLLWSIGNVAFLIKVTLSVVCALAYLYFSPIISLWVHRLQSDAVTQYKIQTLRNEIKVLEHKEYLESKKTEVLIKERNNLEMEVDNIQLNGDAAIFSHLKTDLSEQQLRDMYFNLEKNKAINSAVFDRVKSFVHDVSAAENTFSDIEILEKSEVMKEKFSSLLEDMKKNSGYGGFGLTFSESNVKKMLSESEGVISSYRDFIVIGKKISSS